MQADVNTLQSVAVVLLYPSTSSVIQQQHPVESLYLLA